MFGWLVMSGSPFVSLQPYNKARQDTSMDDVSRSIVSDMHLGCTGLRPIAQHEDALRHAAIMPDRCRPALPLTQKLNDL